MPDHRMTITTEEWRLIALALRRLSGETWGMVHDLEDTPGDHSALYEEMSNHIAAIDTLLAKLGQDAMQRKA